MEDLYYKCPTGVWFVSEAMKKAGKIISEAGYKKVCLLYGGHSLKASGNYEILISSLKDNHLAFMEKGGIKPNPEISFVREILPEVREYKPDLILAVGGGSVIDTAKSLSSAYFYDGDPLDFNKHTAKPQKSLPLAVILTISAAGSEMSDSCVMSDYESGFKGGFNDLHNRPAFSLEDPALTEDVSLFQTSCGLVDIISHSFERYFSPSQKYEVCDLLALSVIKDIVEITPVLLQDPKNYEARRSMMTASTVSHNGWTSFGKKMRFPCHAVEHEMSGKMPSLPHGLGLRFLLPEFLKINQGTLKDKIFEFGRFVFQTEGDSVSDAIYAFRKYLDQLPLPHDMTEVGFTEQEKAYYLEKLRV
jgi:alcohol dehydrogenase YqhD (iron-dependent ADH family)